MLADGQRMYHFLGTFMSSEYTVVHFVTEINRSSDKVCFGAVVNVDKPPKGSTVAVFGLLEGAIISWASRDLKFL
ncbi:hypothetical protein ZIOFF_027771 [Zingiber officinale]|uniref:Uncharacterized protein n=1 Tax=Zingiber officinale TaxID=94328 RepID=A0A8J5GTS0_ZINOF|nr:hypothetical protein ZIOFF_027771 [Zingiber officinale]